VRSRLPDKAQGCHQLKSPRSRRSPTTTRWWPRSAEPGYSAGSSVLPEDKPRPGWVNERMTRYADRSVCPDCSAPLPGAPSACPSCRLPLRHPLTGELFATLSRADYLLGQLRAAVAPVPVAAHPAGSFVPPLPPMPASPSVPRRTGLRPTSVPAILLGLGGTCLLVAAVIFLAVAWSWLGIGGRTAVLAGLTVTGAALGAWLAARGLRVAGEALSTVTFGLLTLDLVGADRAGWLGERTPSELGLLVGLALLGSALAWSAGQPGLAAPQLLAGIGLFAAYAATLDLVDHRLVVGALAVVTFAALAAIGRANRLAVLPWVALAGAAPCWLTLTLSGLGESLAEPTIAALWSLGGPGWALLAAAALLLLPVAAVRGEQGVALVCLAAAASLAGATICVPVADEGRTALTVTALAVVVAGIAVGARTSRGWLAVPLLPAGLASLPVLATWLTMLTQGVAHVLEIGDPLTVQADARLAPLDAIAHPALLVPSALALLGLAWVAFRPALSDTLLVPVGAIVALSAVATLAHHPVPLWSVVVAVLAIAGAAATRDLAFGVLLVGAALVAGLPSASLTVLTTGMLVVACAGALRLSAAATARSGAALVLPTAVAGLLWSACHGAGVDVAQRGIPVALAVGVLAIAVHRWEVEATAAATAFVSSAVAVAAATNQSASCALHLTLLGALVSGAALLHRDRRWAGWIGGYLLATATWVRLADIGVETPEAYTLPSALVLLVIGLDRLHRDPSTATGTALNPGLLLATTPSLLWSLTDPISVRAVLLGAACLVLVLAGSRLRWNSPLVIGASVGGLLVLREAAPYAAEAPQWVMIGLAGALLTVVGVTWERRLVELRQAAAYLDRLR
jgi:hypothetical protein